MRMIAQIMQAKSKDSQNETKLLNMIKIVIASLVK